MSQTASVVTTITSITINIKKNPPKTSTTNMIVTTIKTEEMESW